MSCGCNRPCSCGCGSLTGCVQNGCGTAGTCGCTPSSGCAQQSAAFYNQAPGCQESHEQVIVQENYKACVSSGSAIVVPAIGASVAVVFPGLSDIALNSYLWYPDYGYLKATSFDYVSSTVVLTNVDIPAGTVIPACTCLVPTDEPATASGPSSNYPYVAQDFIAPACGACLDILVTNTNGIVVGGNIQINGGTYRVNEIKPGLIINICNDSPACLGLTPGTSVIAQDGAGNYITPIYILATNPCDNPVVSTGAIIVCKNDVAQPLDATLVGQIPVVVNAETNEVEFQTLDWPTRECTYLDVCLEIISGTATYTASVHDNTIFAVGDIIVVEYNGLNTLRAEITNVNADGHHITFTFDVAPSINVTLPENTSICLASCCEQLAKSIEEVYDYIHNPCTAEYKDNVLIKWYNPEVCTSRRVIDLSPDGVVLVPDIGGGVLYASPSQDEEGWLDVTFCNGSCYIAKLTFNAIMWVRGFAWSVQFAADAGQSVNVYVEPNYNYRTIPVPGGDPVLPDCGEGTYKHDGYAGPTDVPPYVSQDYILDNTGACYFTISQTYNLTHFIPPGKEFKASFRVNVKATANGSCNDDSRVNVQETGVSVTGIMLQLFTDNCAGGVS